MFERFDIVEAYYCFFSLHHGGQGTKEYARLSKMGEYFSPRFSLNDPTDLSENGYAIYCGLCAEQGVASYPG